MSNGYMRQVYICKDSNFSHNIHFALSFYILFLSFMY